MDDLLAGRQQAQPLAIPELDPFIVVNVSPTDRELGAGAYGSVVEVEIPGASVAAKRLHESLVLFGSEQQVRKWISDFVDECKLMSLLRHPNIVQFLGVCYLPGSRLPVLLMEKLATSLDDLLLKHKEIPIEVKYSILIDVTRGLVYLHCRDPPIAHRDLTARNILIDMGLVAKIADLGVARIVRLGPGQIAATMTRAPGNIIYMPPEAVEEDGAARYSTAIDMFSFGNVALFTMTQVFMNNLKSANYLEPTTRKLVARSEIERREEYIQLLYRAYGPQHPVVRLVLQCLEYDQRDRPSAVEVLQQLEEVVNTIPQNSSKTKLELIRQITRVEREKEVEIRDLRGWAEAQLTERQAQIAHLQKEKQELCNRYESELFEKQNEIDLLHVSLSNKEEQIEYLEADSQRQLEQLQVQQTDIETKRKEIAFLYRNNEKQCKEVEHLSDRLKSLEVQVTRHQPLTEGVDQPERERQLPVPKPRKKRPSQTIIPTSIDFKWRKCKEIPKHIEVYDQAIVHNRKIYVKDWSEAFSVCEYTSCQDVLKELPLPPTEVTFDFTLASVQDQLVLVGGSHKTTRKVSNKITMWDSHTRRWIHPYPPMKIGRVSPASVGYKEYLIVIGGYDSEGRKILDVSILDTTNSVWYTAEPIPNMYYYRPVVIEDFLYLVIDDPRVVLQAHVPTLLSLARSTTSTATQNVWESLSNAPFYHSCPVTVGNVLLTVGGFYTSSPDVFDVNPTTSIQAYNPTSKEWTNVGDLPEALFDCKCAVLSGELVVLGGWNEYTFIRSVYIAKLSYSNGV